MKKTISVFAFLAHLASFGQTSKCDQFHIGNFVYSDPDYQSWKVFRTENTQVEIDSIFGYEIEGSIRWISSCEYELVYTKVSDNKLENLIGNKMTIKIVYISNNKIICQSDKKMKMEMIKLNP